MGIGLWIHGAGRFSDRRYRDTLQEAWHVGENPHGADKNRGPGVLTLPDNRTAGLKAVSARAPEHVVPKVERIGGEIIRKRDGVIQLLEPDHIDAAVHAVGFARKELCRVNTGAADRAEGRNSVTDDGRPGLEGILIGPRESGPGVVDDRRRNHALPLGQEVMSPRFALHRPERNADALIAGPTIVDVTEEHGILVARIVIDAPEKIIFINVGGVGNERLPDASANAVEWLGVKNEGIENALASRGIGRVRSGSAEEIHTRDRRAANSWGAGALQHLTRTVVGNTEQARDRLPGAETLPVAKEK